jgi:uncharacterized protein YbjT (DUF2867 family)
MIVITTPTGQIGSQVVSRLIDDRSPTRVIMRDVSRLDADVREHVESSRVPTTTRPCLTRRLPVPTPCSG